MRFRYLLYILLFALLMPPKQIFAQELSLSNIQNIKIAQLSDEQITQVWKKLQDSGIPEQEAYKLMLQKGLPAGEVKNRLLAGY